jgi:excisionase family DNA binding protein
VNLGHTMLSVRDVAEALAFEEDAIRRAIRRGELRASKVCGRLRIAPEDVQAWLQAAQVAAAPPEPPLGRPAPAPAAARPAPVSRRPVAGPRAPFRELARRTHAA